MSAGWITSAAIVGLLASTVIFGWQRSLEHKYLLRKEKRELFVKVLRQSDLLFKDLIDGKMDDVGYTANNENSLEALRLLSVLKLYDAAGVYYAFRELVFQFKKEADRGFRSELEPSEILSEINAKKEFLENEMKVDLDETVLSWPFAKPKRFRFKPTES